MRRLSNAIKFSHRIDSRYGQGTCVTVLLSCAARQPVRSLTQERHYPAEAKHPFQRPETFVNGLCRRADQNSQARHCDS
jgi:hypothetical protein